MSAHGLRALDAEKTMKFGLCSYSTRNVNTPVAAAYWVGKADANFHVVLDLTKSYFSLVSGHDMIELPQTAISLSPQRCATIFASLHQGARPVNAPSVGNGGQGHGIPRIFDFNFESIERAVMAYKKRYAGDRTNCSLHLDFVRRAHIADLLSLAEKSLENFEADSQHAAAKHVDRPREQEEGQIQVEREKEGDHVQVESGKEEDEGAGDEEIESSTRVSLRLGTISSDFCEKVMGVFKLADWKRLARIDRSRLENITPMDLKSFVLEAGTMDILDTVSSCPPGQNRILAILARYQQEKERQNALDSSWTSNDLANFYLSHLATVLPPNLFVSPFQLSSFPIYLAGFAQGPLGTRLKCVGLSRFKFVAPPPEKRVDDLESALLLLASWTLSKIKEYLSEGAPP